MLSTKKNKRSSFVVIALACFSSLLISSKNLKAETTAAQFKDKIIRNINTSGNKMVPDSLILSRIPYKVGEKFDPTKTRKLIHNLYYDLKRFRNITVKADDVSETEIDLFIDVIEKTKIKEINFQGNKKLSKKDIEKKVDLSNIPAIDKEELELYAKQIKKVYLEKNYHASEVTPELTIDEQDGEGIVTFNIKEGTKSLVKRVRFTGNDHIASKELRSIIFTREDWLLNFLDGSGAYQPERVEGDRHIIEQYYQNRGYMMAKVTDVEAKQDPETKHFDITFDIQEGELFSIGEVTASGKEILKDDYVVSRLPVQEGQLYSRENIMETIKSLEGLWGEFGYIYANVDPIVQPDEETKTVNLAFETELGNKIFLNKINIYGNKKTYDKVIRRKLLLSEGQQLTEGLIEASKYRVEALGYFDQKDGVIWRKVRIDDEHADLDLILKEIRTGNAHVKMGFGGAAGDMRSVTSGFSVGGEVSDTNLFGTGIHMKLNASWAKEEQSILFNITEPWLFDKPITGALDIYHRRPHYDDFRHSRSVVERLTGGGATVGFISRSLRETQIMFRLGFDRVKYEQAPLATGFICPNRDDAQKEFQNILDKLFRPTKFFWFETHFSMDKKNHPMHPSRGYKWLVCSRFGVPSFGCCTGFHKLDADLNWYTPLIGENDLVLRLHGYFGIISKFSGRTVPYRELFHIGGPSSVRGFLWGQAGPQFLGDSIGGKKAFFVNLELAFPITSDFTMKGVVFYDGGCGWDNPYACEISKDFLEHNSFNYRHAVGVGIRILRPVPVRIDWGFKLNRNKKLNESAGEVHFGMSYDF